MKAISENEYMERYELAPESVIKVRIKEESEDYHYILVENKDSNITGKDIKKFLEAKLLKAIESIDINWTRPKKQANENIS